MVLVLSARCLHLLDTELCSVSLQLFNLLFYRECVIMPCFSLSYVVHSICPIPDITISVQLLPHKEQLQFSCANNTRKVLALRTETTKIAYCNNIFFVVVLFVPCNIPDA